MLKTKAQRSLNKVKSMVLVYTLSLKKLKKFGRVVGPLKPRARWDHLRIRGEKFEEKNLLSLLLSKE